MDRREVTFFTEKEIDVENAGNLDEKTYEQTTEIINEGGEAAFSC